MSSSHAHLGVVVGHDGQRLYGFDAELFLRLEAKRDREFERQVLEWVQAVVGETLPDLEDVWVSCKSGVILCKLINKIQPGAIPKFNSTRLVPLVERDNIDLFLQACWKLGVPSSDMFNSSDLHSRKAIGQVYQCLYVLSTIVPNIGWTGPTINRGPGLPATRCKARTWDPVDTRPKMQYTDELLLDNTPEKQIHDLQSKLAELEHESKSFQSEAYNRKLENDVLRKIVKTYKEEGRPATLDGHDEGNLLAQLDVSQYEIEQMKGRLLSLEAENHNLKMSVATLEDEAARQCRQTKEPISGPVTPQLGPPPELSPAEIKRKQRKSKLCTAQPGLDSWVTKISDPAIRRRVRRLEEENGKLKKELEGVKEENAVLSDLVLGSGVPAIETEAKLTSGGISYKGMYSNMDEDTIKRVDQLCGEILNNTGVALHDIKWLGKHIQSESGTRAFAFVLTQALGQLKSSIGKQLAKYTPGLEFTKYGRRGDPHVRTVTLNQKTGMVDWGSDKIDLRKVVAIKKGKSTAVFSNYPEVAGELCLSFITAERSLDLSACDTIVRDEFFSVATVIWERLRMEQQAIRVDAIVLSDDNFHLLVYLLNNALASMELRKNNARVDMQTVTLLMDAAERLCSRLDDGHQFVQELIKYQFRDVKISFWEELFWKNQSKDHRENSLSVEEPGSEDTTADLELWLTSQISNWSLYLLSWGLNAFQLKEFMKTMHGCQLGISDDSLLELLRYVDIIAAGTDRKHVQALAIEYHRRHRRSHSNSRKTSLRDSLKGIFGPSRSPRNSDAEVILTSLPTRKLTTTPRAAN